MTHDEIIEIARKKFPQAKTLRVMETTRYPARSLGTTRAELFVTNPNYQTLTLFAENIEKLAIEIESWETPKI